MGGQRAPSIVAIATKYGLIQGVLAFALFFSGIAAGIKHDWVVSVISAALLIVLMFLAHREFKKTHDRMMTYPQGLGSGTLLASVGAVVRCVLVYGYLKYINTGYIGTLVQTQRRALEQRGITGAQAQQALAISSAITTPVGIAVMALITGVIVGFIVALIVSIFTQKADPRAVI